VKLGFENRKQVIALAALGGIAVLLLAYEYWPSSPSVLPSASQATSAAARPGMRRTASGRMVPVAEPRLDPTLDLKLLSQSEEIKYAGNGRNIFVVGSMPIPKPKGNGTLDKQAIQGPPPPPPLPPITLKFFGFANRPGETKKVFLAEGEDVFIAAEGDIVNRRYRVLRISPNAVDVEDVINNNRQSLPLTQG
jgi:hypothetical protein